MIHSAPCGQWPILSIPSLSPLVMANLYRLSCTLLSDHTDINASHFLDKNSAFTVKALNPTILSDPKSKPLYRDTDTSDKDWNELNDINKVIIHQQIHTKYKAAFSRLYDSLPYLFKISPSHTPKNVCVCTENPNLKSCSPPIPASGCCPGTSEDMSSPPLTSTYPLGHQCTPAARNTLKNEMGSDTQPEVCLFLFPFSKQALLTGYSIVHALKILSPHDQLPHHCPAPPLTTPLLFSREESCFSWVVE